jgi:Fe2+ or Zn2+ uptake regulation protein
VPLTQPDHDWAPRLREANLRVTKPRLAVLQTVYAAPHIAADQIVDRVRAEIGPVSVQAVYDTVSTLTDRRILRRFRPAGSAMLFEISSGDNHHHLVCRVCDKVADVACPEETMPCGIPPDTQGFLVDEVEITYWGVCALCLATQR